MAPRGAVTGVSSWMIPPRCASARVRFTRRASVAVRAAAKDQPRQVPALPDGVAPAAAMLTGAAAWLSASVPASAATAAASSALEGAADSSLTAMGIDIAVYLAKTLIAWGVPGGVALVLVLVATSRSGKKSKPAGDTDDDDDGTPAFLKQFKRKDDGGVPKEYLKVVPLNERLDSYSYSLAKVTGSKAKATAENRRRQYTKKFNDFLGELEDEQISAVLAAEKVWVKEAAAAQSKVDTLAKELRKLAIEGATPRGENGKDGSKEEGTGMGSFLGGGVSGRIKAGRKALGEAVTARASVDDKYLAAVAAGLKKEQQTALAGLIKQGAALGWQDGENPMAMAPVGEVAPGARVFVLKFNGNVQASQVKNLREEVTAIVQSEEARPGDEVVLILNTGGGTVTGYGLAAAQLTRLKTAGFKLTVCVEQVAASGGYMMACCADRLVASPFAVLGSIGVISEQPNVYDRLKREGIEFQTVTAGKFKRTLTPFKKPTTEDFAKNKEDIEKVLVLFKNFVASQRPQLDIDAVATGETWFGADALARGLCDELKTTDDVLLELRATGARLFELRFQEPSSNPLAQLAGAGASLGQVDESVISRLLSPATNLLQVAVQAAVTKQLGGAGDGLRSRTRLEDKSADDMQLSDGEDAPNDLWWM